MNENTTFSWRFQRLGGVDQVVLRDGEALRHLPELDPKLWVALSCPTSGLDFDARTLELIDTDNDGRIRIPEVKEAVAWACQRLEDPGSMIGAPAALPLDAISSTTEEGRRLKETAKAILSILDKKDADSLSQEDVSPAAAKVAANDFNGDGILPPLESLDPDVRQYINDALACMGGRKDGSGKAGVDAEISEAFMESLREWSAWSKEVSGAAGPLGTDTPEAWDLLQQLKGKINDYFLRSDLAAFAPQSAAALNPDENIFTESGYEVLTSENLAELPLSHIQASAPLRLTSGINPAWREPLERFLTLINPLLEKTDTLDRDTWQQLQEHFTEYAAALSRKPAPKQVKVKFPPESSIDKLGSKRIREILESGVEERFQELAAKDARIPAAAADITDVERLVLYHRHLYRLLRNFVSFKDFYSLQRPAIFQAGTLFIDGRSCRMCLYVEDAAKHAEMASLGNLFLLYCECRRVKEEDADEPEETMNIVAAVTAGDADLLLKGRNGVYVDTLGRDWDATVVRVLSNSISLREAIWDPYRRFARMIEEQINKFAGAKQNDLLSQAGKKLTEASSAPAGAQRFDIGRNVGIFAAVGIALGAIGTAIGSIASALFSLAWWQLPLVFLGIFLLISGPSVFLAWLNLRKRSLGTILEASGWAVNNRVPISLALADRLTSTADLPPNASRSYADPLGKKSKWPVWTLLALLAAGACFGWLWYSGKLPFLPRNPVEKASVTIVPPAETLQPTATPEAAPAPMPEEASATTQEPAPAEAAPQTAPLPVNGTAAIPEEAS